MNPFSKLSSNKESLNKLKKENKQLKQENVSLLESNEKLKNEQKENTDQLNGEINTLRTENNTQKHSITRYQKVFDRLQTNSNVNNVLVNTFNIISRDQVKKGNEIAGLIVSDVVRKESAYFTSYDIDFSGEFVVKGTIVHNKYGIFTFIVNENLEKLPHSLQEIEGLQFDITNTFELMSSKVITGLEKAWDNKLTTPLEIEGVFKNYSYNYAPGTGVSNTAEFVRKISQN